MLTFLLGRVARLTIYRLSDKETDERDKLGPTVSYLQRLGPEHIDQIFEHSRWVFEHDRDIAFEVSLDHCVLHDEALTYIQRSSLPRRPNSQSSPSQTSLSNLILPSAHGISSI